MSEALSSNFRVLSIFRAETIFSGSRYHTFSFFYTDNHLINHVVLLQSSAAQVYEYNNKVSGERQRIR